MSKMQTVDIMNNLRSQKALVEIVPDGIDIAAGNHLDWFHGR
jgi:hypothetical protein